MSGTADQAPASESLPSTADQSDAHSFARVVAEGMPSLRRAALDQLERARSEADARAGISIGAAVALALAGSAATAIYVRRQARAHARQLAWLALKAGAGAALPGARQVAPLGGAGGSLLLASLLLARLRRAEARLASDRPQARDVLLGAAMGLGLAGLVERIAAPRSH